MGEKRTAPDPPGSCRVSAWPCKSKLSHWTFSYVLRFIACICTLLFRPGSTAFHTISNPTPHPPPCNPPVQLHHSCNSNLTATPWPFAGSTSWSTRSRSAKSIWIAARCTSISIRIWTGRPCVASRCVLLWWPPSPTFASHCNRRNDAAPPPRMLNNSATPRISSQSHRYTEQKWYAIHIFNGIEWKTAKIWQRGVWAAFSFDKWLKNYSNGHLTKFLNERECWLPFLNIFYNIDKSLNTFLSIVSIISLCISCSLA